jgi:uncharacterized membrane protein (DUF485 family)
MMRGEVYSERDSNRKYFSGRGDVMLNSLTNRMNPILGQGLIFGIILGIIEILFNFIAGSLGLIGLLVALALYFVFALLAGRRASQQTGKIVTGVLAGLLTGFVSAFITSAISVVSVVTNFDAIVQSFKTSAKQTGINPNTITPSYVTNYIIVNIVINLVLALLIGLAGGALGGNLGRRRFQPPTTDEYQEALFEPPSKTPPAK